MAFAKFCARRRARQAAAEEALLAAPASELRARAALIGARLGHGSGSGSPEAAKLMGSGREASPELQLEAELHSFARLRGRFLWLWLRLRAGVWRWNSSSAASFWPGPGLSQLLRLCRSLSWIPQERGRYEEAIATFQAKVDKAGTVW